MEEEITFYVVLHALTEKEERDVNCSFIIIYILNLTLTIIYM